MLSLRLFEIVAVFYRVYVVDVFFFFQAEDGIRDYKVTGVQTCALPISLQFRLNNPSLNGWRYGRIHLGEQNAVITIFLLAFSELVLCPQYPRSICLQDRKSVV